MNIGFDAEDLFFNGGGVGVYSRSTLDLLLNYAPENRYTLFSPREDNRYGFHLTADVDTVYPQGLWSRSPSAWGNRGMSADIKRRGLDIFHGLGSRLPSGIRRSGVRSVITMHDIAFVYHPELYRDSRRYVNHKRYVRDCREADRIISVSRQTERDLTAYWGIPDEKIDVVYQACDPIFEQNVSPEYKKEVLKKYSLPGEYILCVGSIEQRKNLMVIVEAMAEHGVEGELVAVGRRTPYADKVMEYAAKHGIEHRIHMYHSVINADLPAIYQSADIFIYPSFYESFGMPIPEALNSRVPVITTEGGVFPEAGGDACIYIDPHSAEQLAAAVSRIRDDEDLRADMIRRGLAHAAGFRQPVIADALRRVYESIL